MWEHKNNVVVLDSPRSTAYISWYGLRCMTTFEAALQREKRIKEWKRDWKINLIERR